MTKSLWVRGSGSLICSAALLFCQVGCGDSGKRPLVAGSGGGGAGNAGGAGGAGGSAGAKGEAGGGAAGGRNGGGGQGVPGASGGNAATGGISGADAGAGDASSDAAPDGPTICDFGVAQSLATQQTLDLFGQTVYYADGAVLPAGRYRVAYLDGCMKYSSNQDWTIHAYANGVSAAWWLVGDSSSQRLVVPPGTVGYAASAGAYSTFEACVAANKLLPPVEFDFAGGKIGVWLLDSYYEDNLAGLNGVNPKWQLFRLGACTNEGTSGSDAGVGGGGGAGGATDPGVVG